MKQISLVSLLRGRPYSAHAARGGGGVYQKRADACRGEGGTGALSAHAKSPCEGLDLL